MSPHFEAVVGFIREVEKYRDKGLCRAIKYVGVAAMMVDPRGDYGVQEDPLA
jgi:hypothetical protein